LLATVLAKPYPPLLVCSLCSFARFARRRFSRWAGLMGALLVCSQGVGRKRCRPLIVCSQGDDQNGEGQAGRREGVGKAKAEQDDVAMDYLLKPSPLFVAGLTLGVATATVVAKIRIKQFWAIPLAGKVVAPCPVMAMPQFLFFCEGSPTLTHGRGCGKNRQRASSVFVMAWVTSLQNHRLEQR